MTGEGAVKGPVFRRAKEESVAVEFSSNFVRFALDNNTSSGLREDVLLCLESVVSVLLDDQPHHLADSLCFIRLWIVDFVRICIDLLA